MAVRPAERILEKLREGMVREGTSGASTVRGVLLDLGGVVYVGKTPIEGALAAIQRLRDAGLLLRFVTNTTRRSHRQVIADLSSLGLNVRDEELLTPALMARAFLQSRALSPFLLVHPGLEEDFAGLPSDRPEAVIVGDAGIHFTYDRLNSAYRKIGEGAPFVALAMNRNFRDDDGKLSLDAGPFVVALEYASRQRALLLGKPSSAFFKLTVDSLGADPGIVAMVGDDAEADVAGAMGAGLMGILVRTGKYRSGDEGELELAPHYVADHLGAAAEWILGWRQT